MKVEWEGGLEGRMVWQVYMFQGNKMVVSANLRNDV